MLAKCIVFFVYSHKTASLQLRENKQKLHSLHFLLKPVNSELRLGWLFLTFSEFSATVVLNLFLIYSQKYCSASLLIRCMKFLFVLAQLETSSCT